MKFKGTPNQLCRITKIRKHLVRKIPKAIRFNKEGIFETENPYLIKRLKTKFEEVKEISLVKEVEDGLQETEEKEEIKEEVKLKDIPYPELQVMYAEKTGKSAVGKRKVDILKELEA
jgi:hypothetical protein